MKENRCLWCATRQARHGQTVTNGTSLYSQLHVMCCSSPDTERIPVKKSLACATEQRLSPELVRACTLSFYAFCFGTLCRYGYFTLLSFAQPGRLNHFPTVITPQLLGKTEKKLENIFFFGLFTTRTRKTRVLVPR